MVRRFTRIGDADGERTLGSIDDGTRLTRMDFFLSIPAHSGWGERVRKILSY